ncbi:hypothetical protein ACFUTR_19875 [Streptomyces sp. NPDC057367]|uniref:hypothetical protein n=1 Tax=Streptomyces sp. NPDC057367 TaxID=3346108 RepID=UPI00363A711C
MANIVLRPKKPGETTYRMKWRQDGSRQTGKFGGEQGEAQADRFRALVEAHGNRWPHGRVKGHGFLEPDTNPDGVDLGAWAHRYVNGLTCVEGLTRADYKRDIDRHFAAVLFHREDGGEVRLGGLVHPPVGGGPGSDRLRVQLIGVAPSRRLRGAARGLAVAQGSEALHGGAHLPTNSAALLRVLEEVLGPPARWAVPEPFHALCDGFVQLDSVILSVRAPFLDQVGLLVHPKVGLLELRSLHRDSAEVFDATLQHEVDAQRAEARDACASAELVR